MAVQINAEFPEKLGFLLTPRERLENGQYALPGRYKVAHGGRGGTKSWAFARALLIRGLKGGVRILCTREVQASMRESVHQLLRDQIVNLGLSAYYRVLDNEIRGPDGTLFIFKGLSDPEALKSAEGVDICWIEEADLVTATSWEKLIPTIRKKGSEVWISFNPGLEKSETYQRFVKNPPPGAIVIPIGWRDNPWISDELLAEKDHLKAQDYDAYLNVWEGHPRHSLEGAVYANEIRMLATDNRILPVPYIPGRPVHTFWDLGFADHTAIWFAQAIGLHYHVIDYYENNRQLIDHYIQQLQRRPYTYGTDWLPHDAASNHPGVERTVERQLKDAGRHVRIVPEVSVADGINAARSIFPVCLFDAVKCEAGLERLRRYKYGVDERKGKWTRVPIHDTSSHAADAFRYMGVALKGEPEKKAAKTYNPQLGQGGGPAWMGS